MEWCVTEERYKEDSHWGIHRELECQRRSGKRVYSKVMKELQTTKKGLVIYKNIINTLDAPIAPTYRYTTRQKLTQAFVVGPLSKPF